MSFVCLFYKFGSVTESNASPLDTQRLVTLLCPYRGDLTRVSFAGGDIFFSSLAGPASEDANSYLIPADTVKNPQTAWAEIQVSEQGIRIQTDPFGMFPLWSFENDSLLVITSEVKSLLALNEKIALTLKPNDELLAFKKRSANFSPYENVARIQPGATLMVDRHLHCTETGGLPLHYQPDSVFQTAEESKRALTEVLLRSASMIAAASDKFATFLSGGIDSSTATALIHRLKPELQTYTLGTEFGDEYAEAADLAASLAIPHHRIFASAADAAKHFERAVFCNETIDGLTAETIAQLSVLGEAASAQPTHIVTGYGADLLFGSMLRHELYMKVTGVDDLQSLIERTCWTGEFSPFFAWSLGLRVHHLFWEPQLMNCAFRIPYEMNYDGRFEKVILRSLAAENGWMLESQAFRKKYALTDGTQFNRVLSNVLGLEDKHAYTQKGEKCIAQLKALYA